MSVGDDHTLTEVLHRVAQDARPARLPADLWSRGRRRHRRRIAVAVAVIAALTSVVAVPVVTGSGWRRASPADERPSVPSRVYPPLPLQSTVQEDPAGPAALILTAPGGFGASDVSGYEDRALVVGRDGSYRWARHVNAFDAGESLLLSPDGRYLAGDGGLEGAESDEEWSASTPIVDLTTGHVHDYRAGRPLAWSPSGRTLLTWDGQLGVLNVDSGAVDHLGMYVAGLDLDTPVAFSADGRFVALQVGRSLDVVDLVMKAGSTVADLGDRRVLAGPGAWTADGRIAVWHFGCAARCQTGQNVALNLTYMDAEHGTAVDGARFETVHARGARLLGWQSDGDAAVVLYREDAPDPGTPGGGVLADASPWRVTYAIAPIDGHAEVVAMHPGGGSDKLMTLPGNANRVDVAHDLLDRFGGAPPTPAARLLDWLGQLSGEMSIAVGLAGMLYAVHLVRRRSRTGYWRGDPAGARRRGEAPPLF